MIANTNLNIFETDPNGTAPHTPGAKLDAGKPDIIRGTIEYFERALAHIDYQCESSISLLTEALSTSLNVDSKAFAMALEVWPRACEEVAKVSAFGASKYTWDGWREVPDARNRYQAALIRHFTKNAYEKVTDDSGFSHMAHIAWNALAGLELMLSNESPYAEKDLEAAAEVAVTAMDALEELLAA